MQKLILSKLIDSFFAFLFILFIELILAANICILLLLKRENEVIAK